MAAPYPCAHSGCPAFHDSTSGLCPEHRGAFDHNATRLCRWCALSPAVKGQLQTRANQAGIGLITVTMGIMESNDKFVLAVTGGSFTLNAACNLFASIYPPSGNDAAWIGVAWVAAASVLLGVAGLTWRGAALTGKIEAMEETAKRYVRRSH